MGTYDLVKRRKKSMQARYRKAIQIKNQANGFETKKKNEKALENFLRIIIVEGKLLYSAGMVMK